MKKFKKLIPAFCAMLVSAAMLGTSTYAWFSVNKKVEANGMSVTAMANTQYFAITTTEPNPKFEAPSSDMNKATAATASQTGAAEGKVIPVARASAVHGDTVAAGDWYTANSTTYDDTTNTNLTNIKKLDHNDDKATMLTQNTYFVGYTFYVGLTTTSSDYAGQLSFTANRSADGHIEGVEIAAVKVEGKKQKDVGTNFAASNLETTAEVVEIYTLTEAQQTKTDFVLKADGTAYVTVTVYLYINGENQNVIDSHIENLSGKIGLTIAGE